MRGAYLKDGFPTHRVRNSEHDEELILPSFPEIFDERQPHPVTETCQWLETLYTVNEHHNPERRIGDVMLARLCVAPTSGFGITEIRRIVEPGRMRTYELARPVETVGNRDDAVLHISQLPQQTSRFVFHGKELFQGAPSEEHFARDLIQPAVQGLLADLGYGDPAESAHTAVDLEQYRRDHDIVWLRPLDLMDQPQGRQGLVEPPQAMAAVASLMPRQRTASPGLPAVYQP